MMSLRHTTKTEHPFDCFVPNLYWQGGGMRHNSAAPIYIQLMLWLIFFIRIFPLYVLLNKAQILCFIYDLSFALHVVWSVSIQIQSKLRIRSCKAVKCWIMTSYKTLKTQDHHYQYRTTFVAWLKLTSCLFCLFHLFTGRRLIVSL